MWVQGKLKKVIVVFFSIFLLVGCGIEELTLNDESTLITSISDLDNTENFRNGALEHILEGELNSRGKAVGFHYDGLPTKKGEVISGTASDPNDFGVYEAEVEVNGVAKTSNNGKSTFFPDEWDAQEVVDAINEAFSTKDYVTGNTYEGLTTENMVIRMYVDGQDQIISAFPIY